MAVSDNKIVFKVEGMSCNHCKKAIENAVQTVEGVTGATVDLEKNLVEIIFSPQTVQREKLIDAIQDAGYRVVD